MCKRSPLLAISGLLLILSVVLPSMTVAQCHCLTGSVRDLHEKKPLANAVISLINTRDSILQKFGRSGSDGRFNIALPAKGTYMLMVSSPKYADFVDKLEVSGDSAINLGDLELIGKAELLESVIVTRRLGAIRIKGDTIEYKADSFLVNKGASVEELLKRLPGIQVNRQGEITAQGQKVNKVLVDGEEFFSDDPAMVTQNLAAEIVQDVQVFDKKSEQAEFTGIDDGKSSKTINLKLKADRKKGYFGKAAVAGGTSGRFDNSVMLNSFKGARKISVFGIMSNTEHRGLDWGEKDKFGAGTTSGYDSDNDWVYTYNAEDNFNQEMWSDQGLPTTWNAGMHYSDAWNNNQHKLNSNYRFMKANVISASSSISRYILPDTQYFNNQSQKGFNNRIKNSLSGIYDFAIDSTSSIRISATGGRLTSQNGSLASSEARNADSALVNQNTRSQTSAIVREELNANLLWRKKFKTKGRTLSVELGENVRNESIDGLLQSTTEYYSAALDSTERIDQKKNNASRTSIFSSRAVYTEPISKKIALSFNYGVNLMQNANNRKAFNKDPAGNDYKIRDSIFSNDFRFDYTAHSGGADIKFNTAKATITLGNNVGYSTFRQLDVVKDTASRYSFVNFFPKALIRYRISQQRQIAFQYNGKTTPPSPDQIQPVRQNNDPLNIQMGNPALRQAFNHNISLYFYDYKVLTNRGFSIWANANVTSNPISASTNVDAGGKTTVQYVNLHRNYNQSLNVNYNWRTKSKLELSVNGNMNYNTINSKINGLMNTNSNNYYNVRFRISRYVQDKYNVSIEPAVSYNSSRSSLRPDVKTQYFTADPNMNFWVRLPGKLDLSSNASYNIRQKTDLFASNRNVIKWDAHLEKKFLKNDRAAFKLSIFDILDQNLGFSRSATSNFISENTFLTLRRYSMLTFVFNFSKTPGGQ